MSTYHAWFRCHNETVLFEFQEAKWLVIRLLTLVTENGRGWL